MFLDLIGKTFDAVVVNVYARVRVVEKQVHAVEADAVHLGLAVRSSMVSRSMHGSAPGLPLPTNPGHMAL